MIHLFIFIFSERAARGGGGGGEGGAARLFFFPTVQQTTSGIGHRVKYFFSGLFSVTIFEVGNIYHGIQTPAR